MKMSSLPVSNFKLTTLWWHAPGSFYCNSHICPAEGAPAAFASPVSKFTFNLVSSIYDFKGLLMLKVWKTLGQIVMIHDPLSEYLICPHWACFNQTLIKMCDSSFIEKHHNYTGAQ